MMPFVGPVLKVQVGPYVVRTLRCETRSSSLTPIGVAELTVRPNSPLVQGDRVTIWHGYRDRGLWQVFSGVVRDLRVAAEDGTLRCLCKDDMDKLARTRITQSFVAALPHVVVQYCLDRAGISHSLLSKAAAAPRTVAALGETAIEVIRNVNRLWDLDRPFYMEWDGTFVWMPVVQSPRYLRDTGVTLTYRSNILAHRAKPDLSEGIVEAQAMPWVQHSSRIRIEDPRYWPGIKTVLVTGVTHKQEPTMARTVIEWRPLPGPS